MRETFVNDDSMTETLAEIFEQYVEDMCDEENKQKCFSAQRYMTSSEMRADFADAFSREIRNRNNNFKLGTKTVVRDNFLHDEVYYEVLYIKELNKNEYELQKCGYLCMKCVEENKLMCWCNDMLNGYCISATFTFYRKQDGHDVSVEKVIA